jgi:hypothetical protein
MFAGLKVLLSLLLSLLGVAAAQKPAPAAPAVSARPVAPLAEPSGRGFTLRREGDGRMIVQHRVWNQDRASPADSGVDRRSARGVTASMAPSPANPGALSIAPTGVNVQESIRAARAAGAEARSAGQRARWVYFVSAASAVLPGGSSPLPEAWSP